MSQSPIEINISTNYLAEQSNPSEQRYVHSYTITITNHSADTVQLISRHWFITDANEAIQEVQGMGVIGEQPFIEPEKSYQYTSGAALETESGTMEGSYQMRDAEGKMFDAPIPLFALVSPNALH